MQGYNFTERVRKVLAMAREEAARLHHEYVGTEHILLGLIREGEGVAAAVLQNLSVDLGQLRQQTEAAVRKGKADPTVGPDLPYTSRAKKVLELAMRAARELDHSYVGTEHLLLGLLDEEQGIAARSLREAGVTTERARAETLRLLGTQAPPASIPGTVEVDITIRTPGGAPSRHTFPSGRDALNFLALRFPDARPWTPAREENAHGQITISDGHVTLHHGRTEPVPGGRRMGIIPAGAHRALDFVTVVAFAVAPTLFGMTGRTVMLAYALAAVHLILTLATHVPGREPRPVPYHVHGLIELLVGAALVALPLLRGWTGGARTFYLGIGVVILLVWLLTSYRDVVSAPRPPAARTPAV